MTKKECEKFIKTVCATKADKTLNFIRVKSCYILPEHLVSMEIYRTWWWTWGLKIELSTGRILRVTKNTI